MRGSLSKDKGFLIKCWRGYKGDFMSKEVGTMGALGPSRDINCYEACEGLVLKSDIITKKHLHLSVNISV